MLIQNLEDKQLMGEERINSFGEFLSETSELIDRELSGVVNTLNQDLQRGINWSLKAKGHRERPLMVRLASEAVGGDFNQVIPLAVTSELIHFSSLVIDDILDESKLRGGYKTTQTAFGTKHAIIFGNLLENLAFRTLYDLRKCGNDPSQILIVNNLLRNAIFELYEGQYQDLIFERRLSTTESQYTAMISKTTAALITASMKSSAILANGNKSEIAGLESYGKKIALALQIRDDIVDIIGDKELIGKTIGGDLVQGKMRLPLIKALSVCHEKDRQFIHRMLRSKSINERDITRCIEILIKSKSIEYCERLTATYCSEAIESLQRLDYAEPAKHTLITFAEIVGYSW